MRGKKFFIGLRALAILAMTLLVTSTWAATYQNEKVLHSFGHGTDGQYPYAGLISDAAGNLYGTTVSGGTYGDGMVFELSPAEGGGWTEQVLYSFCAQTNCPDGDSPYASLIFDDAGNLYGTTAGGGNYTAYCPTSGCGTVFKLSPAEGGWTETVLYSFGANGQYDGAWPEAGLIFDSAGNLYGTTVLGGTGSACGGPYACGTVFELTPTAGGGWTEQVLHSFGNGTDGQYAYSGLIFDASGNLYGTTSTGGTDGNGTVFELTPTAGGGWTGTVLYSFCSQIGCADGSGPTAGLIFDAAGNLYGTTIYGGTYISCYNDYNGCGTVFELTPTAGGDWTEQVLHNFGNGTDGYWLYGGLILDAAGNLYGTTADGGNGSYCQFQQQFCGTVFELTPTAGGGWTEQVLHNFGNGTDGDAPAASLIFDAAGNLYGTTYEGGAQDNGTVFELTPVYPCAVCSHAVRR